MCTQQEKIQRTEEKRCTVNHVAEFENGTPILKEQRFSGIPRWCDWGAPNGVIYGAPFLLLFWSSVTTPLLELRYYSSLGAPLLLRSWSSVTTPLLELHYYSSLGASLLLCSWSSVTTPFFRAPLLLHFQKSVTTPLSEHIQGYPQKMRLQRLLKTLKMFYFQC